MRCARFLLPLGAAITGAIGLAGCAVAPPPGPSVLAVPGAGKDFQAFQQDDLLCRQFATARTGYANPSQAATQSAVGSAVVGTAVGAAAGALIGAAAGNPGVGAAIGAGSGLLVGSAAGTNNAFASAGAVQNAYDISYTQCMIAHGNTVHAALWASRHRPASATPAWLPPPLSVPALRLAADGAGVPGGGGDGVPAGDGDGVPAGVGAAGVGVGWRLGRRLAGRLGRRLAWWLGRRRAWWLAPLRLGWNTDPEVGSEYVSDRTQRWLVLARDRLCTYPEATLGRPTSIRSP